MRQLKHSNRPRTVYLELLYGCNLHCSYCYIGSERNHRKPLVPPLDTTLRILEVLSVENIQEIVLLGGEPMQSPYLYDLCRAVKKLNFPFRGIVTNGTVLTREKAMLLRETGFWVDISFRGPSAHIFDEITGKSKSFDKAFNACLLLSELEIPLGIEYDCVPQNYDKLYDTIRTLVDAGVRIKQVQLHRILPEGDAQTRMADLFLQLDQWGKVFEQAARIKEEVGISVVFEDGFPFCLIDRTYWDLITPCACGFSLLTIGPRGDVRPCPCQSEVIGNILNDSLEAIWERNLLQYRQVDRHSTECLNCDLLEICRAGCSASGRNSSAKSHDVFQEHFRSIKVD